MLSIFYLVGSSIKIKWGLPSIEIAAQSFRLVPPLRSIHFVFWWPSRSKSIKDFVIVCKVWKKYFHMLLRISWKYTVWRFWSMKHFEAWKITRLEIIQSPNPSIGFKSLVFYDASLSQPEPAWASLKILNTRQSSW